MKALVGAFNQEKARVGAFFVIVKTDCETDGSYAAQVWSVVKFKFKFESSSQSLHPAWPRPRRLAGLEQGLSIQPLDRNLSKLFLQF